jgi:hypothetical protein
MTYSDFRDGCEEAKGRGMKSVKLIQKSGNVHQEIRTRLRRAKRQSKQCLGKPIERTVNCRHRHS